MSKLACPIIKIVLPLAKNILLPLGLTVAELMQQMQKFKGKKRFIMEIMKSLENSNYLPQETFEATKQEVKKGRIYLHTVRNTRSTFVRKVFVW